MQLVKLLVLALRLEPVFIRFASYLGLCREAAGGAPCRPDPSPGQTQLVREQILVLGTWAAKTYLRPNTFWHQFTLR